MPLAWILGRVFSLDEQTIGFQGHHVDKKPITYKAEGDGFQHHALCQDGWAESSVGSIGGVVSKNSCRSSSAKSALLHCALTATKSFTLNLIYQA
jgi:hypothetical protein